VEERARREPGLAIAAFPMPQRCHRNAETPRELRLRESHATAHVLHVDRRRIVAMVGGEVLNQRQDVGRALRADMEVRGDPIRRLPRQGVVPEIGIFAAGTHWIVFSTDWITQPLIHWPGILTQWSAPRMIHWIAARMIH